MKARTRTVQTIDVPLGAGRQTLRLILNRDEYGEPEGLSLALGFGGDGSDFVRPTWADSLLSLPASVIGPLRRALEVLEALEVDG